MEVARYITWINDKVGYVVVAPEIDQNPTTDPSPDPSSTTDLPTSSSFDPQSGISGVPITSLSIGVLTYCFTLNLLCIFLCLWTAN